MKKCNFYTMVNNGNGAEALKVNGYTDGTYNFYKNEFNKWFAIVPAFGLSVAQANTRKEAAAVAHSEKIKEAVQRYYDSNINFLKTDSNNKKWHIRLLELIKIKEAAEKEAAAA